MNIIRKSFFVIVFIIFIVSYQNCQNNQFFNVPDEGIVDQSSKAFEQTQRNDNWDGQFNIGFTLYSSQFNEIQIRHGVDIKKIWVKNLVQQGFKLFYVGISASNADLKSWIQLSEELDFKFIALSSSDLTKNIDEIIDLHKKILKNNWGHKNFIAYSIGEEPKPEQMPILDNIYSRLSLEFTSPPIKFHILHNSLQSAGVKLANTIPYMATDRYAFWGWDNSSNGFSATPFFALTTWLKSQLKSFAEKADLSKSEFQVFLTANRLFRVLPINSSKIPKDQAQRIDSLAKNGNMGWHVLNKDYYLNIKYYASPANTIKASIWLSIINNAKQVLFWTGMPTDPVAQSIIDVDNGEGFIPEKPCPGQSLNNKTVDNFKINLQCNLKEFNVSSVGTFAKNQNDEIYTVNYPSMKEIVEANLEISKLGFIIKKMAPEKLNGWVENSPNNTVQRYFQIYNKQGALIDGKILVTLNLNVGQWDSDSIKDTINKYMPFIIDRKGELANYISNKEIQKFAIPNVSKRVFDLFSEKEITGGEIEISPGSASLIFIGDEDQFSEVLELKQK